MSAKYFFEACIGHLALRKCSFFKTSVTLEYLLCQGINAGYASDKTTL